MFSENRIRVFVAIFAFIAASTSVNAARLTGKVTDLTRTAEGTVHVKMKTRDATVEACLGAHTYLVRNDALPRVGDEIEVEGGYDNPDNPRVFIAKEIRIKGRTLMLRHQAPLPSKPPQ